MHSPDTLQAPVGIIGGGVGGVAAALALAEAGASCILTEPTDWLGGQLTSQAVPPDENRWIEGMDGVTSATRLYLAFRQRLRQAFRTRYQLKGTAQADPQLNPGGGWVSRLCFPPVIGEAVLRDMLAPHLADGRITLLMQHRPVAGDVDGDRIRSVTLEHTQTGERTTVQARLFLDATETGDLYPLLDIEHRIGAESQGQSGELHAPPGDPDPLDQQAVSWCFALEHRPGEDHRIAKPEGYADWAAWVPAVNPPWVGPMLSWTICDDRHSPRTLAMTPWPDEPKDGEWELWRYRRIVDRSIHLGPEAPPDVSLINCVQMDYFRQPTLGVTDTQQADAFAQARAQSLAFLHWMQTDAPRHDGGTGYPGLRLRGDELGTADGFAKAPYIREPRRLEAQYMLSEADVGAAQREQAGLPVLEAPQTPAGQAFHDTIAIGHYPIDLHPSCSGRNQVYIPACPFQIPLRSLLPVRVTNLIAAGKALGVTHIANGCTRLHPVEWGIGEAAGLLSARCVALDTDPQTMAGSKDRCTEFQQQLQEAGAPLTWPWDLSPTSSP